MVGMRTIAARMGIGGLLQGIGVIVQGETPVWAIRESPLQADIGGLSSNVRLQLFDVVP